MKGDLSVIFWYLFITATHAVAEDFHVYSFYVVDIWEIMKALQNGKVRSQEIPGVTGKFGHGVQN